VSVIPCSRVLLEKLTGFQLVKKFPAFYGTGMFISSFTIALPGITGTKMLSSYNTRTIQYGIVQDRKPHSKLYLRTINSVSCTEGSACPKELLRTMANAPWYVSNHSYSSYGSTHPVRSYGFPGKDRQTSHNTHL
jgi:hypothetical protein